MKIPKKYKVMIVGEPTDTKELKDVDGEYWANCKDGFWCVLSDSHTLHGETLAYFMEDVRSIIAKPE